MLGVRGAPSAPGPEAAAPRRASRPLGPRPAEVGGPAARVRCRGEAAAERRSWPVRRAAEPIHEVARCARQCAVRGAAAVGRGASYSPQA